jgi:hypothetical protein
MKPSETGRRLRYVNNIMAVGVDNRRGVIPADPRFRKVVEVDMPVYEVLRLKGTHKPEKGLKPPMAPVGTVMDAERRGVGEQHVQKTPPKEPVKKERRKDFQNGKAHLPFGILVVPVVIPHRPPKSGEDKPLLNADSGADRDRAAGCRAGPLKGAFFSGRVGVMVSQHEEERFVQTGHDKIKILEREVPGAEYQVYIPEPRFNGVGIYHRINLV